MSTLRTSHGLAVLRPARGDILLTRPSGLDAATVLPDPDGVVSSALRRAAAKNLRRNEEKKS